MTQLSLPQEHTNVRHHGGLQITLLTEVHAYFRAAQELGDTYTSAGVARTDVLSILRAPADASTRLRCEQVAQWLAGTARERSREQYWWALPTARSTPYRLSDLDHQQSREELVGNLHGLCGQLGAPHDSLADLAPVLALMAMDLLRLTAAVERPADQGEAALQHGSAQR